MVPIKYIKLSKNPKKSFFLNLYTDPIAILGNMPKFCEKITFYAFSWPHVYHSYLRQYVYQQISITKYEINVVFLKNYLV